MAIVTIPGVEHGFTRELTVTNSTFPIWTVTSGRIFKPLSLIVTNKSGDAIVEFYDSQSGASGYIKLHLVVPATKTVVLHQDELVGITFQSAVMAATNVSGTVVTIGGVEY